MEQLKCSYWAFPGLFGSMSPEFVIGHVCMRLGISRDELMKKSRRQDIVDARRICMNAIRENNKTITYKQLGNIFDLDHATALHSIRTYRTLYETNTFFRNKAKSIFREPIILIS